MILLLRVLLFSCSCAISLLASSTTAWEMNTYQDFLRGRFTGVALTRDGAIRLAPKLETVFTSDQPAVWAVATATDGTMYLGTGHRGRVFQVDKTGKASLYWTSEQPEIFALALHPDGSLYAASSPNGKVYRISKGKATEFFVPKAQYIWSLAFAPDGSLFVGTGGEGKIFRVDAQGRSELYFESGQAHITALAMDGQGRLLAGSEPNGLIYRIAGRDKGFVIYDASLPEIRRLVPVAGGDLLAVALGGSAMAKAAAAAAASQAAGGLAGGATAVTTITVEASAQAGPDLKPKVDASKQAAAQPQVTSTISPILDLTGMEKSAIYRIHPDNTVETLWSSKEENAYDLLPLGTDLYLSTDAQGRIYRLSADRHAALVAQLNEGETTRLVASGQTILAATADMGKLYRMGPETAAEGVYEAPVHDAATVARWGRLSWRGAGTVAFQTRSGNSARPDKTWSDWSPPFHGPESGQIVSPNARFLQWRVRLSAGTAEASVENVSVAYLPQNNPPAVKAINVSAAAGTGGAAQKPAVAQQPATASYSITVTDTGEAGASTLSGTPAQTLSRPGGQQMQIAWQAEDPDGDRLIYAIYFRGEDEREWKLLKANVTEAVLMLDADSLADGRYLFRVVASDRLANPPGLARDGDLISAPVVIDNTPPVITAAAPRRNGNRVEVAVQVTDSASPLRRCEHSVDAGTWIPLDATDGVTDSRKEDFQIGLDNLPPGEHVLVIRAYDSAGNAGLAKVILR